MPISSEQFDNGLDEGGIQVQKFLAANPDQAYELEELAVAMGERELWPGGSTERKFAVLSTTLRYYSILEDLVRKGAVEKKRIQGKDYYRISLK
jgi:hypothetical protein